MAILTSKGAVRASFPAVADPVRTREAEQALGAVQLIVDTVRTFFALVTHPVRASGAFLTALYADCLAHFVASAAFVLALAAFKAEFTVVAQTAIFHTLTAFSAVVFAVAVSVGSVTAVIPVVAFPVVITISAAELAFYTVLVIGINRNGEYRQHHAKRILTDR